MKLKFYMDYFMSYYTLSGIPTKAKETIEWFYNGTRFDHEIGLD